MIQRLHLLVFICIAALAATGAEAQWSQTDREQPTYPNPVDFGNAVAADGDWALVGDYRANGSTGAVGVYQRASNGTWSLVTNLTPPGGGSGSWFGYSVDLSVTGTSCRAIVGAPRDNDRGAAYLYTCGSWASPTRIQALNPVVGDSFGFSVSISGSRSLVGAFGANAGAVSNAGAAYVFELLSGIGWTQVQRFTAAAPVAGGGFGFSVALDGGRAAIGAPNTRISGLSQAGAAYVFDRVGSSFTQTALLTASDQSQLDRLGWSITLAQDVLVAGSIGEDAQAGNSGAAYVYSRDHLGVWAQRQKLKAPDAAASDQLGVASATLLNGAWIAVGAPSRDDLGASSGAVYIFRRTGCTSWVFENKILASGGGPSHLFGSGVALDSRLAGRSSAELTLLAGAPGFGTSFAGAAYWLERSIPSYYIGSCRPR